MIRPSRRFGSGSAARLGPTEGWPEAAWLDRWLVVVVAFGVVIRAVRYLTNRPLWGDEAMVAVNVLGRGFGELLEPLSFFQVAPAGFLWIERALVVLLGPSEWSLRLAPAACGVAAVPLFAWMARRAVGPTAALLGVTVFAVSYAPIRHAVEVKPYAFDLLAALVLLAPAVAWIGRPGGTRPLWMLVVLAPIAMACSHPATFVAGGIGLALLPAIVTRGGERPGQGLRRVWAIYLGVVGLAFLGIYELSTGDQSEAVGGAYRRGYWAEAFPPIDDPLRLPIWLVMTHVGEAFGYPIGGEQGASVVSAALAVLGLATLVRRGNRGLAWVLLAPLGMTLVAALLGRYPYGGAARTMQHVAPTVCLLVGVGAARLIDRLPDAGGRARLLRAATLAVGLIGAGMLVGDLVRPYRTPEDQRTRDFARWFWPEVARGAEVGCSRAMRGTTFDGYYWRLGRLELYLANRALSLPEGRDPARPRLDRVAHDRPLRIVAYNDDPRFDVGLACWLDVIGLRYRLREIRSYTVNAGIVDDGMGREERFLVFEYVPRDGDGGRVSGG